MKKNVLGWGILAIMLALGTMVIGCDNGTPDDSGGGPFSEDPKWDQNQSAYSIKFYAKSDLQAANAAGSDALKVGFSVTADDESQTISSVYVHNDKVEISFGSGQNFTGSTVIKLSYDGTGALAGLLDTFSVTVTYDAAMYSD
jgi:hypothetical protein